MTSPRHHVPRAEHRVRTPDGRSLGVAEWGPEDGAPVVYLHGTPGSRHGVAPDLSALDRLGVLVLSFDRPGYGGSDLEPGRSVADGAGDVLAVVDAFGLETVGVIGYSGGGPHALACAALIPDRTVRCALVGSPAPFGAEGLDWFDGMSDDNLQEFHAALAGRESLEPLLAPVGDTVRDDVGAFLAALGAGLPADDAQSLRSPGVEEMFAASMRTALADGVQGWVDDDLAFVRDWGFTVGRIRDVAVEVWHGSEDTLVPVSHARWNAGRIAGAEGQVVMGAGHFGPLHDYDEVLRFAAGLR